MIFGYARVSTVQQSTNGNSMEDQVIQLKYVHIDILLSNKFN
jgi:DNA invertase Pin-like site-specific DNA recombinase